MKSCNCSDKERMNLTGIKDWEAAKRIPLPMCYTFPKEKQKSAIGHDMEKTEILHILLQILINSKFENLEFELEQTAHRRTIKIEESR